MQWVSGLSLRYIGRRGDFGGKCENFGGAANAERGHFCLPGTHCFLLLSGGVLKVWSLRPTIIVWGINS